MTDGTHEPVNDDALIGNLAMLDRAAVVVVWDKYQRGHVRRTIALRLGHERASQTRVILIQRRDDLQYLDGINGPVFIHADWFACARNDLRQDVIGRAMMINLRPRPQRLERSTRFES